MRQTGDFGKVHEAYTSARQLFPEEVMNYIWSEIAIDSPQILDVGCGTGIATRQLHERGAKVLGIDIDAAMIEEAKKTSPDDIAYFVAPTHSLPFQNKQFDSVTAFSSFHWFKDKTSLLEIKRVLRENGRFFVINKNDVAGFRTGYRQKLERLLDRRLPSPKDDYHPARILEGAGFHDVTTAVFPSREEFSFLGALHHIQSAAVWNEIAAEQEREAVDLMKDHIRENSKNNKAIRIVDVVLVSGLL
jgi:ubiquinone/menaquinone biosynthesis C-methylase UbiE